MAGLNETPSGERVQIALFGRTNAGKSALINAITGQSLAIVSSVAGTTTDPVSKSMELLPLGPVTLIDTPGLDDSSELGAARIEKARQVMTKCDIALIVVDATRGMTELEEKLISEVKSREIAHVIAITKSDLAKIEPIEGAVVVSSTTGEGIEELKNKLAGFAPKSEEAHLIGDIVNAGDVVILVTPIDKSAPKGRLILPQQQTIRDLLEAGAMPLVCRETELEAALEAVKPSLVVTDSQVFGMVSKLVPGEIPLTSFSMLMARYKGNFADAVSGARMLDKLVSGDKILISEGCTHHRQCEDIGTVKLPAWIRRHTGAELEFEFTSGNEFHESLDEYALIVHCGGCTLNPRALKYRYQLAKSAGVPITNYGVAIAHMNGILERVSKPLLK